LKKNGINLGKLESEEADAPLGEYTGAAAIYGGSGGVMESALRTAQAVLCGPDSPLAKKRLDFKEVRGLDGIKETTVDFGQAGKLRVAVANGMANVQEALKKIDQYDYIEMMACPGGCIGGGGEPLPTNPAVRQARMEALIKLDKQKKIREAHKNQSVKTALAWLKEQGHETEHRILHTKYFKRK
jgi:iron only hydrogenase large subunit-like protein